MQYLRLKRGRLIVGSFVLFALLAVAFPEVDLRISRLFYDGRSFLHDQWWQKLLQVGLGYLLGGSFAVVLAIYLRNCWLKRSGCLVNGRRVLYLLLVAIIGAGLIVNVGLKNQFGRARPRDVVEFGGTKHFSPAFVPSTQCNTNCSFSSGDAAGGFFFVALALAFRRRRRWVLAALAFGAVVSISRMSSGAHFFSDTVASFFVMLLTADVLHYYVVLDAAGRERARTKRDLLLEAPETVVP